MALSRSKGRGEDLPSFLAPHGGDNISLGNLLGLVSAFAFFVPED